MKLAKALVKGPKKDTLQDAVAIHQTKSYALFIVSDGLGSAKHSDFGAKMILKSVINAIRYWRKLPVRKNKNLIRLIHFYWKLFVEEQGYTDKECAATCLFTYIDKETNKMVLAQLGDGVIFYEYQNEITILSSEIEYNYTVSICSKKYKDWKIKNTLFNPRNFSLFLATDGVSEDIVEGKLQEFVRSLINEIEDLNYRKRNLKIKKILNNWPTKCHSDDKSICLAWENKKK